MRIVALDSYDNRHEGEEYDCPDNQARQLIAKGLAKAGPVPLNKMAPPCENKSNPSQADGEAQPSSASPAAPASPQTTAIPYPGGGLVTPDPRFVTETPTRGQKAAATRAANKAKSAE